MAIRPDPLPLVPLVGADSANGPRLRAWPRNGGALMRFGFIVSAGVVLLAGRAAGADDLKSGPQVGDGVPGGFGALFINGDHAGRTRCPV